MVGECDREFRIRQELTLAGAGRGGQPTNAYNSGSARHSSISFRKSWGGKQRSRKFALDLLAKRKTEVAEGRFTNSSTPGGRKRSRPGGSFLCGTTLTGLRSNFSPRMAKLNVLERIVRYLLIVEAASGSFSRSPRKASTRSGWMSRARGSHRQSSH
jgi:hypothetical protein